MDLRIDEEKIRLLSQEKAWSQEHLAHVSGLGRRTVQRIEETGSASYESAQAIASALELNVSDLIQTEELQHHTFRLIDSKLRKITLIFSSIVVLLLVALGRSVMADQISLDIEALVDEEHESRAIVSAEEGVDALIQIAGDYRILVTPSIAENGNVRLDLLLLKLVGEEYTRVGRPVLQTPNGAPAEIRSSIDDGRSFSLTITPNIL